MSDPIRVVSEFCAELSDGKEGLQRAIRRWFTPDTVWVNTGLATTTGVEEALALIAQLEGSMGIHSLRIEILSIAADGHKVLTERRDTMLDKDGAVLMADPVMGIFEVEGEQIRAWRDYFDSAAALSHAR